MAEHKGDVVKVQPGTDLSVTLISYCRDRSNKDWGNVSRAHSPCPPRASVLSWKKSFTESGDRVEDLFQLRARATGSRASRTPEFSMSRIPQLFPSTKLHLHFTPTYSS
jgi:hypothetical protein